MPHIIANYSANLTNLDQQKLLKQVNTALTETAGKLCGAFAVL